MIVSGVINEDVKEKRRAKHETDRQSFKTSVMETW